MHVGADLRGWFDHCSIAHSACTNTNTTNTNTTNANANTNTNNQQQHETTDDFDTDEGLQDRYRSPWGTVRLGRIFEDLDALAGTIAFEQHAPLCPTPRRFTS